MRLNAVNRVVKRGKRNRRWPAAGSLPPDPEALLLFHDVSFHRAKNSEQFILLGLSHLMMIQR